eukprot:PITA_29185
MSHPVGLLQPLPVPKGKWESISMDFITGLPMVQGKDCIFVVVDRLTKYTYFFAISAHYTAAQVAELFFREIFKLYGLPKTIVNDRDNRFMGEFWQELFRAPRAKIWIQESQDILRALKDNMASTELAEAKVAKKLKPRFYGPYKVTRRIGQVAYELELPQGSKIHNIFHVSCLKKALGQQVTVIDELPPMDDEGHLVLQPEAIIDTRERQLRSRTVREFLVRWKNLPDEDATWESEKILQHPSVQLPEDKQHVSGGDYNIPN